MNIVLIGMKYTGKSTLGRGLSERRGMLFRDTDTVMEEIHDQRHGQALAVRDIFAQRGEVFFNSLEVEAVKAVAAQASQSPQAMVVSLGGRCPLNAPAAALLKDIGPVVYLRNSVEVLLERLAAAPLPAFLDAENAARQFMDIYNVRKDVYAGLADAVVELDGLDVPDAVAKLDDCYSVLLKERNS